MIAIKHLNSLTEIEVICKCPTFRVKLMYMHNHYQTDNENNFIRKSTKTYRFLKLLKSMYDKNLLL